MGKHDKWLYFNKVLRHRIFSFNGNPLIFTCQVLWRASRRLFLAMKVLRYLDFLSEPDKVSEKLQKRKKQNKYKGRHQWVWFVVK